MRALAARLVLVLVLGAACVLGDILPGLSRAGDDHERSIPPPPPDDARIFFPGDDIPAYPDAPAPSDAPLDYDYSDAPSDAPLDYDYSDAPSNASIPLVADFDELSSDDLAKLNRAAMNLEEMARLFDIDLPNSTVDLIPDPSLISVRAGHRKKSMKAVHAVCEPELRTVELDLPNESNTFYMQRCVRLHRCGGCCFGSSLSCQPTSTEEVNIEVVKVKITKKPRNSGTPRGSSRPRRKPRRKRRSSTEFTIVKQLNHTSCDCQCKVMEKDCDLGIHVYLKSDCKCLCLNKDDERKCLKKNDTHFWDSKKCECVCRDTHACSSWEVFSHKDCRCEAAISARSADSRRIPSDNQDVTVNNPNKITPTLPCIERKPDPRNADPRNLDPGNPDKTSITTQGISYRVRKPMKFPIVRKPVMSPIIRKPVQSSIIRKPTLSFT